MMTPARVLAMLEADRASARRDPKLLTDDEKDAALAAAWDRIDMLESICLFAFNDLQSIERVMFHAGTDLRAALGLILALCRRRWEWATPVTSTLITDPETGTETYMRRAL